MKSSKKPAKPAAKAWPKKKTPPAEKSSLQGFLDAVQNRLRKLAHIIHMKFLSLRVGRAGEQGRFAGQAHAHAALAADNIFRKGQVPAG